MSENETFECGICGRSLDPRHDGIVYLMIHEWAAFCLCAPTPDRVRDQSGSPCVNEFRKEAVSLGFTVVPSDEEEYLRERSR
jgi:hypothetical protein